MSSDSLVEALERIEARLDAIDGKLASLTHARRKSMEWIGQLAGQVDSLDVFREEVRASFEPVSHKLDHFDEMLRIVRHATSNVAQRLDAIEAGDRRKVG